LFVLKEQTLNDQSRRRLKLCSNLLGQIVTVSLRKTLKTNFNVKA